MNPDGRRDSKPSGIRAVRRQQPTSRDEFSESSRGDVESDAPCTALVPHGGRGDTEEEKLLKALPALARSVRAAMHELDGDASGSFSEGSSVALPAESLPELAKVLQAKVRELARMHEARAVSADSLHEAAMSPRPCTMAPAADSSDAAESRAAGSSGEGRKARGRAAGGDNAAAFGSTQDGESDSGADSNARALTEAVIRSITLESGPAHDSIEREARKDQRNDHTRVSGDPAGGALTHGETDELERRGDAAAARAALAALSAQCTFEDASRGGNSAGGGSVCQSGSGRRLAPGVAAELAAELSGALTTHPESGCGDVCSTVGCSDVAPEAAHEPADERAAAEDGQTLQEELRQVRGMIAEMRKLRDAVAAGHLVKPGGGSPVRYPPLCSLLKGGRGGGVWRGGLQCLCCVPDLFGFSFGVDSAISVETLRSL